MNFFKITFISYDSPSADTFIIFTNSLPKTEVEEEDAERY